LFIPSHGVMFRILIFSANMSRHALHDRVFRISVEEGWVRSTNKVVVTLFLIPVLLSF
jgi:hypothetical protein